MQKGRKIVALTLAVLLVLSAMTCFSFAAPTYAQLPKGYMVVDAAFEGMQQQESFEYELGGELYKLEFGVTAFASVDAASAAWLPDGEKTIVLAPGTYSSAMTLTSDINLCGPYFGKNPNNNPNLPDYDDSAEAWSLKNDRSIDPTKEAVFTANISIGTGCNNLTIDGIAFTGGGRIIDTSRSATKMVVNYNFKNLYFKDSTVTNYAQMNTAGVNRYVHFDSIRIENNNALSRMTLISAETLEFTNSYVKNLKPDAGTDTNSLIEYLGGLQPSDCLTADKAVKHSYRYNHFESIGGINAINFAARESGMAGVTQRDRVILELIGNEFVDVGSAGRTIQDQISASNQEFVCINNRFVSLKSDNSTAFGTYFDGVGATPSFARTVISGNTFIGFSNPISGATAYPYIIDSTNVAYDATNKQIALAKNGCVVVDAYPENFITAWQDGEVLEYNGTRRLYIYPEDKTSSVYTFSADKLTAKEGTTFVAYTGIVNGQYDAVTNLELNDDENKTELLLDVTYGGVTQTYNVVIYAYPELFGAGGVVDAGGDCDLFDLRVKEATDVIKGDDGYVVTVPAGTKKITPYLSVSKDADYWFYMDKAGKYPAQDVKTVKLESLRTVFYVYVTAVDGFTVSAPTKVTVISPRSAYEYVDFASVPSYAKKAVNYLNNSGYGIFSGDHMGKLNPNKNITRYELAKVMVVLTGLNTDMAEDVKLDGRSGVLSQSGSG